MHESVTLSLTGNRLPLSVKYKPSINVNRDSEIALLNLRLKLPNANDQNDESEIIQTSVTDLTIKSIKVMCDIAQGSFDNEHQSHSICEITPREKIGVNLIYSTPNPIYYKLNKTNINSITIQLADENNELIDSFSDFVIVLHIKRRGS